MRLLPDQIQKEDTYDKKAKNRDLLDIQIKNISKINRDGKSKCNRKF